MKNTSPISTHIFRKGMSTVSNHNETLLCSLLPSADPVYHIPMDFRENPTHATHMCQGAEIDLGQSAEPHEKVARLLHALVWGPKHLLDTFGRRSGLVCRQHLLVLSQRTCQAHLPFTLSSFGKFSWREPLGALYWYQSRQYSCLMSPRLFVGSVMVLAAVSVAFSGVLSIQGRILFI